MGIVDGQRGETGDRVHLRSSRNRIQPLPIFSAINRSNMRMGRTRWLIRSQSHKWTVYVRGATNEDLSAVVKQVVFQFHSSFNNPTRVVEAPPFELSETGWGEFEIAITLHFHSDVCDKPLSFSVG